MRFFNSVNLQDAPIKNFVLEQLASDTGSPSQGEIWYNTTVNFPKIQLDSRIMTISDQYVSSVSGSGVVSVSGGLTPTITLTSSATSGQALLSQGTGVAPAFGALNLAGGASIITGILPVANGGSGVATGAANLFFATPNGSLGATSLRSIVAADLPTSGVTAGAYPKVTVDTYGRVTAGTTLLATDIPTLSWSIINSATTPTTLSGYGITDAIPSSQKGANSGVASLDASGKVPTTQLPTAVLGALSYQGTWDANANSPTIPTAASGNKGFYYKVATSGSTTIDTISDWKIGDWIVSNGTTWDKIDNTDSVSSVAGRTGAITLAVADVSGAAPLASPTFTGTVTATTFAGSGASLTSIPNSALTNNTITVGSTSIALGASATTFAGLTSVTSTTFVGALTGNATSAGYATNTAIINDAATSSAVYPTWVTANTGNLPQKTTSTRLSFVPSTGILMATGFAGSGAGLTSIPNSALTNTTITVGSTSIALGASATTLAGLTSVTSTTFVGALTGTASLATSLASGAAGSIPYQTGAGVTAMLATGSGVLVGGATPSYSTTPTLTGTNFTGIPGTAINSIVATATLATNATNIAITDDITTSTSVYPTWVTATTGNLPQKTSSTKLTFTPSTGTLSATTFAGAHTGSGAGLTAIPNTALVNDHITVGTTLIALGASSTTLAGLTSVTSTTFVGALTGNASTVTTNANLTGEVTSVGNATTLANVGTAGTYTKVTTNARGLVTSGTTLSATDIPSLDFAKVTTGIVPILQGGTGATTAADARTNLGVPSKVSGLIGDGTTTAITFTHNLGLATPNALFVSVCIESTGEVIFPDVTIVNANSISIIYGTGLQPATNAHRVTVIG